MIIAKIGRRGQITLPSEVRRRVHLKEGDRIAFIIEGHDLLVKPLRETLLDLRGTIPVDGPQDFAKIRKAVLRSRAAGRSREET
ncbi:MAG: AbrB/MazE/SpoVT family DNA-binding domain-containing protein [Desulfobacterota bacterium U4-17]